MEMTPNNKQNIMKFKQLTIGQSFDFIAGNQFDSFFLRCTKINSRTYMDSSGVVHKIGSISANVYNVA